MTMAILGSALFFVVAPSVVAGLIPWWITRWEFLPPFFDLQATRAVGILLIVAGLPGLVDAFARFALQGLGTPALSLASGEARSASSAAPRVVPTHLDLI